MLTTWQHVRGNWVLGRNSDPLGRVRDLVVNPETGEIPALWINTSDGMSLLATSEIHRWHSSEIFVESPADLISPDEFPRLKNVLEHEVKIINAPVFELREVPIKIGHCTNFNLETRSPHLISIEIKKGWLFWEKKRIIPRIKIEEINSHGIFVTSTLLTERTKTAPDAEILSKAIPEAKISQSSDTK